MTSTARLYGDSLYDLAAEETLADTIREQMQEILQLFRDNPDYVRLLGEPSLPPQERTGLVEAAFGGKVERYLVSFIKLLCDHGIIREYEGCCEEFTRRYYEEYNIAEAVIVSAVAPSREQLQALKEKLETLSGKKVLLRQRTDPAVLGGLRVELEGKQFDGTVQGRISDFSRKLNEMIV